MQLEVESSWQPIEQQATKEGRSFGPGQGVGQSVTPGWEKCWVKGQINYDTFEDFLWILEYQKTTSHHPRLQFPNLGQRCFSPVP